MGRTCSSLAIRESQSRLTSSFLSRQPLSISFMAPFTLIGPQEEIRLSNCIMEMAGNKQDANPFPAPICVTDYIGMKSPNRGLPSLARRVATLTPQEDRVEEAFSFNRNQSFIEAFYLAKPIDGHLNRDQVLNIFTECSTISHHHLTQIFQLVDFCGRHALDVQEFCLGMHILEACNFREPLTLPPTIPADIQHQLNHLHSLATARNSDPLPPPFSSIERFDNAARPERVVSSSPRYTSDDDDGWSQTDSMAASSARWSKFPGSSYSDSCKSTHPATFPDQKSWNHKYNSDALRMRGDVPAGNQYFMEEINSLRAQLQDLKQRVSVDMPSHLPHDATEVHLTSALGKMTMQYEASQALLSRSLINIKAVEKEKTTLSDIVDKQGQEIAKLKADLEQANINADKYGTSSNAGSPDMRVLFLRASLRKSQDEVVRVRAEIARLLSLIAIREDSFRKVPVSPIPIVGHTRKAPLQPSDSITLEALALKMDEVHQLVMKALIFHAPSIKSENAVEKIKSKRPEYERSVMSDNFDSLAAQPGLRSKGQVDGSIADTNPDAHTENRATSDVEEQAFLTPPESPQSCYHDFPDFPQAASTFKTLRKSKSLADAFSTSLLESDTVPLYIAKKRHDNPSPVLTELPTVADQLGGEILCELTGRNKYPGAEKAPKKDSHADDGSEWLLALIDDYIMECGASASVCASGGRLP